MKLTALDRAMANTAKALSRIEERSLVVEKQEKIFLPGLQDWLRAMDNHVARSSLFAPIARDNKKYHNKTVLVSRRDAVITYTGYQLNEAQADIWMQLIFEAKNKCLGESVCIHRAAFLKAMGRTTSGQNYDWLHRAMLAFTSATIVIEVRKDDMPKYRIGHTKAFHMLSDFEFDDSLETYTFTIDPRWKTLFSGREYSLVDWEKRMQIRRGQDMAKALQRLVATSSDPLQRYDLDWLKDKLQYAGRWRDFKRSLSQALCELERVEVIAGGRIGKSSRGGEQVIWSKLSGRCSVALKSM
ncbi:MAG: plasmid replication initiator TrfA [Aquirhabdus sp.]